MAIAGFGIVVYYNAEKENTTQKVSGEVISVGMLSVDL